MTLSAEIYDVNKRFLWGVCYRMTGDAADAEDIVQETFVKALEKPPADTHEPWRPWLLRVAINLSRDHLRRRRQRAYVGPWLPSPVPTDDEDNPASYEPTLPPEASPAARYDLLESLSVAFLLALEALTPAQRAVLLLRDVFDYSTGETAAALGVAETTVKVTLHRARRVMSRYDKERAAPHPARGDMMRRALEQFLHCLRTHDADGLERLLAQDVVVLSDGGGEVAALAAPMRGRDNVLRLVLRLNAVYRDVTRASFCWLNGLPAVLFERRQVRAGHASRFTMQCEVDETGRLRQLHYVFAPGKLAALR